MENAKELRQKAINLIYLILLALLFSYIPSDFIDSVHHSDLSMNLLCDDVERLGAENKVMFLEILRDRNEEAYNDTKDLLVKVDQRTGQALAKIGETKFALIDQDKYNEFGFLKNGKRETVSNDLLIEQGRARELMADLQDFKSDLKEIFNSDLIDAIDSILPTPALLRHSDGDYSSIENFYFFKNPLNISVLNLSHFKGRVEEVRSYIVQNILEEVIEQYQEELPSEVVELVEMSPSSIGNANFIQEFYEEIEMKRESKKDEDERDPYLYIESETDSVYPSGQPLRYAIQFDTSLTKSLTATVRSGGQIIKTFTMYQPGVFIYTPERKGIYDILFRSPEKQVKKRFKVIDTDPVLQNVDVATLYIGIDNALNIRTSEFEDTELLEAEISKGIILKKGKNFYARVNEPGLVKVQVFAQMPYGKVKVADKEFVVRNLANPIAKVNGIGSGDGMPSSNVSALRSLQVESSELLVDEQFFISDFTFTVIYNNHTAILKPIQNVGNSINASSMDAISRAQKGDILIFDNINAKSTQGREIKLAPINLTLE